MSVVHTAVKICKLLLQDDHILLQCHQCLTSPCSKRSMGRRLRNLIK
jgi:hypothetical protein